MDRMAASAMVILIMNVLGNLDAVNWIVDNSLDCPSNCHCLRATTDPSLLKTDCSDKNYWLVPMGVSQESTHVNLARNMIDYLPSNVLSNLMKLEVLDLSGNQIDSIKEGVFSGLQKLTTL